MISVPRKQQAKLQTNNCQFANITNNGNSVIVSGIVPHFDNLNNKATEVNNHLVLICAERNILFISHSESIDSSKYLNKSKLHLNFAKNFSSFLTKFDWQQQQKIDLPTSVHLNSERESHAKETLESNVSYNNLTSPEEQLHNLRLKSPSRLICSHLNINSLRNKFDLVANIVKDKIDILMISETKLDSSFSKGQSNLNGFS